MANAEDKNNDNREESTPFLPQQAAEDEKKPSQVTNTTYPAPEPAPPASIPTLVRLDGGFGWSANGLPLGHGSVVGEPMERSHWDSCLFACLGRNDEFCSSDLEVCLIGSVAPCVLYGSNAERLGSRPGTFANHCLAYLGLYVIGNSLCGGNFFAPWMSYPSRRAIRRRFNLQGSYEAFHQSCGCCCCGSVLEDELRREQCESACDFATHIICHPCALCQEARELRRRLPHPGFDAQPVLVMLPPGEQTMGRGA